MITATEFAQRRAILLNEIKQPVILTAFDAVQYGRDSAAPFLQEANFLYLTGINAPGWHVIMTAERIVLVMPSISESHQLFDGSLSADTARELSGIDEILSRDEADVWLKEMSARQNTVATLGSDPLRQYYDFTLNPAPDRLRRKLSRLFDTMSDCRPVLSRLRAIKSPAEITAIETAVAISQSGFAASREGIACATHEYQIEASLTYHFRQAGAAGHAYDPIVAAGVHACTLHYATNDAVLRSGELILIDAGARVDGYAADVTRTYAIGPVSDRQRAVHVAVQSAHQAVIELLRPGLAFAEYQERVESIMKDALASLGLLQKASDYRRYFPHAISHGLGLDVHDSLGGFDAFQPGMVLTVEPGIYIPEEGIGVRIEDDILITDSGHRNLSGGLSTNL